MLMTAFIIIIIIIIIIVVIIIVYFGILWLFPRFFYFLFYF